MAFLIWEWSAFLDATDLATLIYASVALMLDYCSVLYVAAIENYLKAIYSTKTTAICSLTRA